MMGMQGVGVKISNVRTLSISETAIFLDGLQAVDLGRSLVGREPLLSITVYAYIVDFLVQGVRTPYPVEVTTDHRAGS